MTNSMISTPILRELVLARAARAIRAKELPNGFVLTVQIGSDEKQLSAQRGGGRIFKTLDSLARYVESIGGGSFEVFLAGHSDSSAEHGG